MKALIVAAGFGSRLRAVSPSKPLTEVAGVPMIARVIDAARAGGATEFVVVTGHEGERLSGFLARLNPAITCVATPDWGQPNGHSVLTGADVIGPERHLLMMADHLFDPEIVRSAIASVPAALTLAVDRNLDNPLVDLDDVTRVRTQGDRIVAIGKHLDDYDAFDCGIFCVDGRFHAALRAAIAEGRAGSISDGVTALAQTGDARIVDVSNRWWLDVDDPRALGQAEAHWVSALSA